MRSKKTSGIYKIENKINHKVYIGSSVSIEDRWIRHKTDLVKGKSCSIKLQNSYNKHGVENFEFYIIEECEREILIEREQFYIDYYRSYEQGYNCCPLAGNSLGFSHSEETRDKIRISVSGDKNPFYGKKHTEESRVIMRESHKGQISSFKGRHHTEETKEKLRYPKTDEHKEKISVSAKGRKHTEESINRRVESRNGYEHSEETKLKIGSKHKGKKYSEETRKKLSNSKRKNKSIIIQYDLNNQLLKEWDDLISLKTSGYIIANITRACAVNGKSGGFRWEYKEKK